MILLPLFVAQAGPGGDPILERVRAQPRLRCEGPAASSIGKPHPGAEQLYAGSFRIEGGRVVGEERRYLFANDAWKALTGLRAGKDCVDVWKVVGRRVPARGCPTCSFGIQITVDIDPAATTCERRLNPDGNHFSTLYNVAERSGGRFELFFESGKPLAEGEKQGDVYVWATKPACTWF